ncbi:MAG: regulatory protein RecX [Longimicrobiales bacterium]
MSDSHITRIEPLPPRGLRVRVHPDVGDPFEVALEAIEMARLGVGDPLTPTAQRALLEVDADVRIREAALTLLSHRARTRQELQRKLRGKRFDAARVDACLDRLEERGLLSDEAVAAAFVRDRLKFRPRGRARLSSELRTKGVAADVAENTIARVFEDEAVSDAQLARESGSAWLSRQGAKLRTALGSATPTPERDKARRRLHGYLARRGFRGDALTDAIRHAEEEARS